MEERVEATSQPALRRPGQHAFSRARALNNRMLYIVGSAVAVTLIAWAVFALRGLPFALLSLVSIGVMGAAHSYLSPKVERWLQGAEGEREVAAVLAQLKTDGWQALHDISLGGGNIDHILVGRGGIFTIETKSNRGRIGLDHIDPKMFKQAYAQKKLLERITSLDVQPLLVFSQAYLVGSVPAQRKGVTVLPARMLQHYFSRRRPTLETNEANKVYTRLAAALPQTP